MATTYVYPLTEFLNDKVNPTKLTDEINSDINIIIGLRDISSNAVNCSIVMKAAFTTEIDDPSFTGSGLDDCSSSGTYTYKKNLTYRVQIDGTGASDTIKWSKDGGATWEATGVIITGSAQDMDNGVQFNFAAITGHTIGDYWDIEATTGQHYLTLVVEQHDGEPLPSDRTINAALVNVPKTVDNKYQTIINQFPSGYIQIAAGRGDDIANNLKHKGDWFSLAEGTQDETDAKDFQFLSEVYLVGGKWNTTDAGIASGICDYVNFKLWAPSSADIIGSSSNLNYKKQNKLVKFSYDNLSGGEFQIKQIITCGSTWSLYITDVTKSGTTGEITGQLLNNKLSSDVSNDDTFSSGGVSADVDGSILYDLNRMIKVEDGTGTHSVDLTTLLNPRVNITKAVPIPNATHTGYFNYDVDDGFSIRPDGDGYYDIFDQQTDLGEHVQDIPLWAGEFQCCNPAVKSQLVLPQWKLNIALTNKSGNANLRIDPILIFGRKPNK